MEGDEKDRQKEPFAFNWCIPKESLQRLSFRLISPIKSTQDYWEGGGPQLETTSQKCW